MFEESLYTGMGLTLDEINVNYEPAYLFFKDPVQVNVVVAYPAAQDVTPDIAIQTDKRLTGAIDKNFYVDAGFVETQQIA